VRVWSFLDTAVLILIFEEVDVVTGEEVPVVSIESC
jgi:hypothetical protein